MPLTKVQSRGTENVGQGSSNVIINGAMKVAQRSTSETGLGASSGYFTLDRFKMVCNNTAGRFTMSQDSSAPDGFGNSLKLACTTADTSIASNEEFGILYRMEGQDLQHLKKGTSSAYSTTLSFYVKGNASATYVAELMDGDNSSRHVGATFNVTTDWTRVAITFPADTTGTLDDDANASLDLQFFLHAGSNNTSGTLQTSWGALAQANRAVGISSFFDSTDRTFFITGIQFEVGSQASDFQHEAFERTLHKCYRYYYRESLGGLGIGSSYATNAWNYMSMITPATMRADPTASYSGGTGSGTWHSTATTKGVSAKKGRLTVYQKCNGANLDIYVGGSDPLIPILDAEL